MTHRRDFMRIAAGAALSLPAAATRHREPGRKQLRGIFPILQTPFTEDDKLDTATLAKQVVFLDKGRVHGAVWPQLASEYSILTMEERLAGAEAILGAARGRRISTVIGCQGPDLDAVASYARHAEKHGADALIALPPANQNDLDAVMQYYKSIGQASSLPLFVQAVGKMSVDFIIEMSKQIPTLRFDKDEAGALLPRISQFRQKAPDLGIFSGGHGKTLLDEMHRGSAGSMPAAGFADLYAQTWDLWQAGKRKEATEMFGRTMVLCTEVMEYGIESLKFVLHARGVFPNYRSRKRPAQPGSVAAGPGSGLETRATLDEPAKEHIREILKILKPYLRA
ncbi:MAG: dihydrodipicolinate synthase family protein [Acidobacteria bacterium]|nr:dihydrodipicolinate synthase family protein [Acidobacteriota bacterium]